jgi:hypothetical protein
MVTNKLVTAWSLNTMNSDDHKHGHQGCSMQDVGTNMNGLYIKINLGKVPRKPIAPVEHHQGYHHIVPNLSI